MVRFWIQKFHCQYHKFTDIYFKPLESGGSSSISSKDIDKNVIWIKIKSAEKFTSATIFFPFPSSQHIFWVYWARKPRLISQCSVLFILQNLLSNGKDFGKHNWKNSPRFKIETEVNFMLFCALAKMRLWDSLHYTPQITCQNQSAVKKENVNELSFNQVIDEGSMRTNLVTILQYF